MAGKYKIVMVRHGESEWNQKNLFCGWFDANLSEKGFCHFFPLLTFSVIVFFSLFLRSIIVDLLNYRQRGSCSCW